MQEDEQRARLLEESIGRCGAGRAGPCGGYGARGLGGPPSCRDGVGPGGAGGAPVPLGAGKGPVRFDRAASVHAGLDGAGGCLVGPLLLTTQQSGCRSRGGWEWPAAFSLGPSWRQPIG